MNEKVLLVDDEEAIVRLLEVYLKQEGYQVFTAFDAAGALDVLAREEVHLAILDVMLPDMDGFTLCSRIRGEYLFPIILLTAKTADMDKINGLSLGADDYITKPFNPLEVIARIQSNLRRKYKLDSSAAEENGDMLTVGELKLDTKKFILYKNGEEIMLTPTEFKILSLFMEKPGMVFTKAQIYQRINGDFYETDDNTMMVHISKLRDKLGDNSKSPTYIKTVRGLGYKIEKKK